MNKSILLASLLAAAALTACSKKEEPKVETPVVTPAPAASSPGVSPAWSRDIPSLARRTAGMWTLRECIGTGRLEWPNLPFRATRPGHTDSPGDTRRTGEFGGPRGGWPFGGPRAAGTVSRRPGSG